MLTEQHGKAGKLCSLAQTGKLHCPLLIRNTSEDVVTGQLIQALSAINPRWWLPELLNRGLGDRRFRKQIYRSLKIAPWVNFPPYPRELLPYEEGSTQVDVVVTWENAPTTVFIEAKYASDLSAKTANVDSSNLHPTDQLIRNIRVGLYSCGYFKSDALFDQQPRDFVVLLFTPFKGHRLVQSYRDESQLRKAIPKSHLLSNLPPSPFVGEIDYRDVRQVLQSGRRFMTRAERLISDQLTSYLSFKLHTLPHRRLSRSSELQVLE